MTRRERLEHWIAEQESDGVDGSWQWYAMVDEFRALWSRSDVLRGITSDMRTRLLLRAMISPQEVETWAKRLDRLCGLAKS